MANHEDTHGQGSGEDLQARIDEMAWESYLEVQEALAACTIPDLVEYI